MRAGRRRSGLIPAHAGKTLAPCRSRPGSRAHPRSRGENQVQVLKAHFGDGSSPLTRGKLGSAVKEGAGKGLIPAHAGKTLFRLLWARRWKAHPRSRGENIVRIGLAGGVRGSSPLTRGKRQIRHKSRDDGGFIPAHAGKTRARSSSLSLIRAHPRSRGENPGSSLRAPSCGGSSPLTRGKRLVQSRNDESPGLIPAHAGKTRRPARSHSSSRAHPRSRGENVP